MPFDAVNGVGRLPQVNTAPIILDTGIFNEDVLISTGTESPVYSATITRPQKMLYAVITLTPSQASPGGNAVGAGWALKINGAIRAQYVLPSSEVWGYGINDIVQINEDFFGTNSVEIVEIGANNGGTSYNYFWRVVFFSIPI